MTRSRNFDGGGTAALIEAALAAKEDFEQKATAAGVAADQLQAAAAALQQANQALHDDLAANGPAVVVDQDAVPMTVTLYAAADPDTYSATEIRLAG